MTLELLNKLPAELRLEIEVEWGRLQASEQRLEIENKLLKEELRLLRIEKYGPKSEQLSDAQLELLEVEPGVVAAEIETEALCTPEEKEEPAKKRNRSQHGRAELPAHLSRVEKLIVCTAEQCLCAGCGNEKKIIGYDVSEELDVQPAVYFVQVTKREKRVCTTCQDMGVTSALLPLKIIDRCKASNRVIVEVIISKYCNYIPLYRQSLILWRDAEIELSRTTLCGWVMQAGEWAEAINRAQREELLSGTYIQADETPIGVHQEGSKGSNHRGYLWEYSRPGGPVVFDFQMGRSREGPKKFLRNFGGILQCDGYAAYDDIGGPGIVYAGCMAHVRRGFVDALKAEPKNQAAKEIVALIGNLYHLESRARGCLSPKEHELLRKTQAEPLLETLKKKITELRAKTLPKSALGKACGYALGQWKRVIVYVTNEEVEIDNNWCENAIRPIALGRKNWLHIGSEAAGPKVAAIASLLETCRRLGINAREYLLDVLPKVADWPAKRIGELTPTAWARQQAAR